MFYLIADDETDRASTRSSKSRSSSVPAHKGRNAFSTPKPPAGKNDCNVVDWSVNIKHEDCLDWILIRVIAFV